MEYIFCTPAVFADWACAGCGALVGDRDLHDAWHENLGRVAQQADHADIMTRPIGGGGSFHNPMVDPFERKYDVES